MQQDSLSMMQPATFDTNDLQSALTRSQQVNGTAGGMRRAVSLPQSMNSFGLPQPQENLPPSGGPMRRVASSLGMRRSSSFFWTPAAHLDFERAIGALTARGADVTPGNIMQLMTHLQDLKMTDIDRHLKKKQLVQRRILHQLNAREASSSGAADLSTGQAAPPGGLVGVAEEPTSVNSFGLPAPAGGAALGLLEDHGGLIAQLDQQKMQHREMAAMRESMMAAVGGPLAGSPE